MLESDGLSSRREGQLALTIRPRTTNRRQSYETRAPGRIHTGWTVPENLGPFALGGELVADTECLSANDGSES